MSQTPKNHHGKRRTIFLIVVQRKKNMQSRRKTSQKKLAPDRTQRHRPGVAERGERGQMGEQWGPAKWGSNAQLICSMKIRGKKSGWILKPNIAVHPRQRKKRKTQSVEEKKGLDQPYSAFYSIIEKGKKHWGGMPLGQGPRRESRKRCQQGGKRENAGQHESKARGN